MRDGIGTTILLLTLLIASGCASSTGGDETGSSAISVNNFEATPNPIPSRQQFTVNMELENTGDSDAESVYARIFGPSFINSKQTAERTENFNGLRSSSDDSPSIPKTSTWQFKAPDIGENREIDYTLHSKIFYDYETRANTDFRLVSQDRFEEEGYTQGEPTLDQSEGPINMRIRGTTPKIFYEDDGNQASSDICVVAENQGDGTAFTGGDNVGEARGYELTDEVGNEDTINLAIEEVDGISFQAEDTQSNSVSIELIGGEEGYQCFEMIATDLSNSETSINTRITADYNYVEETETSVTVEGRRN